MDENRCCFEFRVSGFERGRARGDFLGQEIGIDGKLLAPAGGGKGAVIGAGVGGGAGTGYVLVTKGDEVDFGPETRFSFTLSESLKLPVYPTSGSE